jgi:hypothetical protein
MPSGSEFKCRKDPKEIGDDPKAQKTLAPAQRPELVAKVLSVSNLLIEKNKSNKLPNQSI